MEICGVVLYRHAQLLEIFPLDLDLLDLAHQEVDAVTTYIEAWVLGDLVVEDITSVDSN